jgi:D-alanyl-D-alanine carboxypeptidase/D-alanyl-D-alanine-endopeptidase (penicillin-binding protein 4)
MRMLCLLVALLPATALADWKADVEALAGSGIVYVVDAEDAELYALRAAETFVPASTLKVMTTLLAAEYIGLDERFETRFFLDGDALIVQGRGDPFLVSEELDVAAKALKSVLGDRALSGVFVDDAYFEAGITIPGVGGTDNPYDALNSATAVNFNTIHVSVTNGVVTSAEEQTPLTPLAELVAKRKGVRGKQRINLSQSPDDVRRYAAELVAAKLRAAGVKVGPDVGTRAAPDGEPLHVHANSRTVGETCASMLYYSNNYIANQMFLAVGAAARGAPASLAKSVEAAEEWLQKNPELGGFTMLEGSGIAHGNEATAQSFAAALRLLEPHRGLLRVRHGSPSKTGTLKVTKTLVGYIDTKDRGRLRYVISLDGGGAQKRWDIVKRLSRAFGGLVEE